MKVLGLSGGKDSMACLHLLRDTLDCAVYVDTGYGYPEIYALIKYAETILPVHRIYSMRALQNRHRGIPSDIVPIDWTAIGQEVTTKKSVMLQSYLDCCWDNITAPLYSKALKLEATELVLGQRLSDGHQATSKSGDVIFGITRTYPIKDWTSQQVLEYLEQKMDVPPHYYQVSQHSSLDCYDCPAYEKESSDRITWTKLHHPMFYKAYKERADAVKDTLEKAMI